MNISTEYGVLTLGRSPIVQFLKRWVVIVVLALVIGLFTHPIASLTFIGLLTVFLILISTLELATAFNFLRIDLLESKIESKSQLFGITFKLMVIEDADWDKLTVTRTTKKRGMNTFRVVYEGQNSPLFEDMRGNEKVRFESEMATLKSTCDIRK